MPRNDPIISVRIPEDIAAEVAMVARVEEVNVSEVIRAGVYRHLSILAPIRRFRSGSANAWGRRSHNLRTLRAGGGLRGGLAPLPSKLIRKSA